MSETFGIEFEKRLAEVRDLPVVKLEITTNERLFEKYDVVVIGDGCYLIISRPIKTEAGFTYMITPYDINLANLTATLVDTILQEF